MDRSRIAIVIPALNEAATIFSIVKNVSQYGLAIVVSDGSIDSTAELAAQAGAIVVRHEVNQGYDMALNSGFHEAAKLKVEIIITVDADGQHNPDLISKFIDMFQDGYDVVLGVRSRKQRIAEHIYAFYTKLFFNIKDPLCGMKAYRSSIYQSLGHFDSFNSIGTELMIFAAKRRLPIGQIYFNVLERDGESRFGKIFFGNYKIIRALIMSIINVR